MQRVTVLVVGWALLFSAPSLAQTPSAPLPFESGNVSLGATSLGGAQGVSLWSLKLGTAQRLRIRRFVVLFDEDLDLVFAKGRSEGASFGGGPVGLGMIGTAALGYSVLAPGDGRGELELLPFVGGFYEFDINFKSLELAAYGIAAGVLGTYWFPRTGLRQYGLGVQVNAHVNFSHLAGVFCPGGSVWLEIR